MAKFDEDTLYILDSYGLIYRAYFAFISHPLTNSKGENISAVFGFFRNLANVLQHYKPKCLVAALDSIGPTFRHERYPEYKANRPKSPDDLIAQIPWIEEILETLGIPSIRVNGYEADDVIATLARKCEKAGRTCRVLSGDKDLMQLVNDQIQILKPDPTGSWKVVGPEGVKAEWGVMPEGLLDLLSLYGDTADNVPGVKGVGIKTGLKYLEEYGSLEGIYEHADEIKGAIGEKIRAGRENAFFSKELITLCETVPLDDLPQLEQIVNLLKGEKCKTSFEERYNFTGAAELLMKYEAPSLAKSFSALGGKTVEMPAAESKKAEGKVSAAKKTPEVEEKQNNLQIPEPKKNKGKYKAITGVAELKKYIDGCIKCGVVAYDSETTGLDTLNDKILGFSLSCEKGTGVWVPISAGDSLFDNDYVSKDDAFKELARIFDNPKITVVMHNAKFDYKVLVSNGMKFEGGRMKCNLVDTLVAAWLMDPDKSFKKSHSLENLGIVDLGLIGIEYGDIVGKKQTFSDVPLEIQAEYASEDADFTLQLWQKYEPELKEKKLWDLFSNLEMPLLKVLVDMEIAGIHLNTKSLDEYDVELTGKIEDIQNAIYAEVGHSFNIASPKQLGEVLFEELGYKATKKTKTGYSTDNSVLEELAQFHPLCNKIIEFRELSKLQSTYVEALPKLVDSEDRIHTSFMQTGTATGRLSSTNPNLQNIPVRNEMGRRIRSAFTAPKGKVYISADYSQIELVVLSHLSGDPAMCKAFNEGIDVHKATASMIYGVGVDEVTPDMRRTAKTINFGVIYGMGAFSLAKDLGISNTQGRIFIDKYYEQYSSIRKFMDETISFAENTGYLETILGRRRYIAGINSSNKMLKNAAERIAKNTPVQGSAADIVKLAMLSLDKKLRESGSPAKLLLQVHDELILECPDDKATIEQTISIVKECMENAMKLSVPLKVSVEYGKNWGEFH
ncbi:MAG: DNA polymerase I [Treponema sp.]|nr:DNA polymerase I [Treponema sp.]